MKNISCVIAHYDPKGHVPDDLIELAETLRSTMREIIFVSTNINLESIEKLERYCKVISRENFGYDFWSYKIGIDELSNKQNLDEILILNSSIIVFDPDHLCGLFFKKTPEYPALYGITESNQISHHLQSYWISFCGNSLINSNAFKVWWDKMEPISNPSEVIQKYEIGMSKYFNSLGVPLVALYQPDRHDKIISSCRAIANGHFDFDLPENSMDTPNFSIPFDLAKNLNPTSLSWDRILKEFGIIKVKSLSSNNHDFRKSIFFKYLKNLKKSKKDKIISRLTSRQINI